MRSKTGPADRLALRSAQAAVLEVVVDGQMITPDGATDGSDAPFFISNIVSGIVSTGTLLDPDWECEAAGSAQGWRAPTPGEDRREVLLARSSAEEVSQHRPKPKFKLNSGGPMLVTTGAFLVLLSGYQLYFPSADESETPADIDTGLVVGLCFMFAGAGIIVQVAPRD